MPNGKNGELNTKQQLFVLEYLKHFNASQAYKKVYNNVTMSTAGVQGHKHLKNPKIKRAISEKIQEILGNTEELTAQVVQEYKKIGLSDISEYMNFDGKEVKFMSWNDKDTKPIESIQTTKLYDKDGKFKGEKIELKLASKIRALDGLARYLNFGNADEDKKSGVNVTVNISPDFLPNTNE